ncbi:histidine kinase [Kitasatospora sp. NPDC089797]|uniref:sensor histidine kinase n=1 Tax=Kitasatospora sp. NPDC089797 TaxID=3155298 RepID=UPI0034365855
MKATVQAAAASSGLGCRSAERLRSLDPLAADALVALSCAALAVLAAALKYRTGVVPGLTASAAVAALCSVSLLVRRHRSELPLIAGLLASIATDEPTLLIFGAWALARYGRRFRATVLWATATAYLATRPLLGTPTVSATALYHLATVIVLPGLAGAVLRRQAGLHDRAARQVAHLQASVDQAVRHAVLEERGRIAYRMHDDLGHQLAVVALHADVIRLNAERPDKVRHSAEIVHDAARTVMTDLHRILDLLRRAPDDPAHPVHLTDPDDTGGSGTVEEQHGTPFLDTLVANLGSVGVQVTHRVDGPPRPLPASLRRALLRIARECLVNAVKHAPGATVDFVMTYHDDQVGLTVTNGRPSGGRATALPGSGLGLAGLTALVNGLGGTIQHGPDREGHRVSVTLPVHGHRDQHPRTS